MVKGKRPVVITADTKAFIEQCGMEIIEKLGDQWFEVDGTPTVTVKYPDGQFKKKPLIAGWNFKIEYAYVGQRGTLIFGLTPEDAQEYAFIEMDAKQMDNTFPMVGPSVAPLFGLEGEKMHVILEEVIAKRMTEEAEAKKAEIAKAETNYDNIEEYGMF